MPALPRETCGWRCANRTHLDLLPALALIRSPE
jgi:hypothetical protein